MKSASLAALLQLLSISIGPSLSLAEDKPAERAGCSLEASEDRTVTKVVDGETLIVDGGSQVRLIGALAPRPYDAASPTLQWPLAEQSRLGLEQLVAGQGVRLAFAGRRNDRHGRLLAHVFVGAEDQRVWVQGEMLKRGLARAYGLEGSIQCLAELIAHETIAREKSIGLWAETIYAVRPAEDVTALLRLTGTFQLVEGRVVGVSSMRTATYINFGEDWRQDFTAVIRTDSRRAPTPTETLSKALNGRRIRVRGWIERRGGPLIAIIHPSEIEVLAVESASESEVRRPTRRRNRRQ